MLALLPASASAASAYAQVERYYQNHGQIPPCQFSSRQLEDALKGIDTYAQQYFGDFPAAIQSALTARASGACLSSRVRAPSLSGPVPSSPPLRPLTAAGTGGIPAPLLILGLLAVCGLLVALASGTCWWLGVMPPGLAWSRHLWSETSYRARNTWLELGDWLRSGSA